MPRFHSDPSNIDRTLHVLCRDIGNRLAATENEHRAAEYVADQMRQIGLSDVTLERFPFRVWGYETAEVRVLGDGARTIEAIPVANSPATPEAGIEAEVVYVDNATPADLAMHDVEGKVLLIWGLYGDKREKLQMLQRSDAVGVLWVDDRLPFDWPVSAGTPYDWRDTLQLPQLTLPYFDALELAQQPGARVRMISRTWSEPAESVNVLGDLPGPGEELVHVGAHIDSVIVGVGAEDDGSGVAAMLEAARMLVELGERPERTVRFCAFGAEEQLSEGARQYVEAHPEEVDRTRLMVQLDSVAAITGRNQLRVVGPPELTDMVRALIEPGHEPLSEAAGTPAEGEDRGSYTRGGDVHRPEEAGPGAKHGPSPGTPARDRASVARGAEMSRPSQAGPSPEVQPRGVPVISGEVLEEVSPYSDMFPFNARGAPSVWLHRMNQAGTRYFHHSHLDDLQSISSEVIAMHANATAHLTHTAAFTDPTWQRTIPQGQMTEIEEMAKRFFP
ncbi:MAG: M20/M25/M40 family metallo-hydrolase [Armatimonadota bacterium]|nr:M20/M25/M40 family metallo-hydrolase [Armatimonadota bacterium]